MTAAAEAPAARRREEALLADLRDGRPMGGRAAMALVWLLSVPTVLSELSTIAMEYIDAAMVGRLGSGGAAAIGLVASSTWLLWGLLRAGTTGFAVIVSQEIGARRFREARSVAMQGFAAAFAFSVALGALGSAIAAPLPRWLGGAPEIRADASRYFLVFMSVGLPITLLRMFSSQLLQSAGDMRTAGAMNVVACALDVLFNFVFIFPSRTVSLAGADFALPGFGLGVAGAAVGTVVAETVSGAILAWLLLARHPILGLRRGERLRFERKTLRAAAGIGLPIAFERLVMTGAMVASTAIVAPLGAVALAANSFAITAESVCYMPGYGIGSAASTLVGQAIGAGRRALARRFAWLCTWTGVGCMAATGALLYAFA
ncbi:MAG: MATE family efflux transporter, partial [Kiritimatiellae bacterium]|nr:MATE family efflux transporter [Kiritimatiellia bacterium]